MLANLERECPSCQSLKSPEHERGSGRCAIEVTVVEEPADNRSAHQNIGADRMADDREMPQQLHLKLEVGFRRGLAVEFLVGPEGDSDNRVFAPALAGCCLTAARIVEVGLERVADHADSVALESAMRSSIP